MEVDADDTRDGEGWDVVQGELGKSAVVLSGTTVRRQGASEDEGAHCSTSLRTDLDQVSNLRAFRRAY